ncbi:MAG: restriction endonuclease subunit S [Alcanivorax sp.]|jgi:type I restriction enzyme S subunit
MSLTTEAWSYASLEDLLIHVIGGDWGKDESFIADDYKTVSCIRGSEFKNWKRDQGSTAVNRRIKTSSLNNRELRNGDVLIEISGGGPDQPVGRTVLITSLVLEQLEYPAVCTNFLRMARPSQEVSSTYLNYYLTKFYLSGEVVRYQGGSNNLRNLKFKDYSGIAIPIPLLAEQKIIAEKLDILLAQVETTKARLERIPEILKTFRQSVLAAAVSGKLTEEWRGTISLVGWKNVKLDQIVEKIEAGKSLKCIETPPQKNEFGIIKISAVTWGSYDEEQSKTLPNKAHFLESRRIAVGDFLISRANTIELLGNPVIVHAVTRNLMLSDKVLRLVMNEENKSWVSMFLRSKRGRKEIESRSTGNQMSMRNIGQKALLDINLPKPQLEEQTEIVRRVEELFAFADSIEQKTNAALERVNNLTQSILAKAFRGELTADWRAENPDLISGENSAEALLAKIKAEREKLALEKKAANKTRKKKA